MFRFRCPGRPRGRQDEEAAAWTCGGSVGGCTGHGTKPVRALPDPPRLRSAMIRGKVRQWSGGTPFGARRAGAGGPERRSDAGILSMMSPLLEAKMASREPLLAGCSGATADWREVIDRGARRKRFGW